MGAWYTICFVSLYTNYAITSSNITTLLTCYGGAQYKPPRWRFAATQVVCSMDTVTIFDCVYLTQLSLMYLINACRGDGGLVEVEGI
ncbi:unnamed protein product [Boreogadus saida]